MDRIREKPSVSNTIREKAKAAPKELVHRGLDGGAERLRTQLRDTAQQGRQDGYGGDRIEDTAADGMRRMERGAEKLIKERKKNRADAGRDSGGSTLIYLRMSAPDTKWVSSVCSYSSFSSRSRRR